MKSPLGDKNWTTIHAGKSQFKIVGLSQHRLSRVAHDRTGRGSFPRRDGFLELIRKTSSLPETMTTPHISSTVCQATLIASEKKTILRVGRHRWTSVGGCRAGGRNRPAPKAAPQEIKAIIPKKAAHEMQRLLGRRRRGRTLDRVYQKSHDFPEERAAADLAAHGRELPELSASHSERERRENRG